MEEPVLHLNCHTEVLLTVQSGKEEHQSPIQMFICTHTIKLENCEINCCIATWSIYFSASFDKLATLFFEYFLLQ
ncbi:rCG63738 [Rattus norvegicus]|uniref:RCG63738 n=1 Tax=Rattus norvegicus TaxID=10116 RepID=A6JJ67_RAT|nr:rCG63738 [Rattus norvegicus]